MRSFSITDHPSFVTRSLARFPEHSIFTGTVSNFALPEHRCTFGLIYPLTGSFTFTLNGLARTLDENKFLLVNRNSLFSMNVRDRLVQPLMLYFQSRATAPDTAGTANEDTDWNLTERIYPATEVFRNRVHLLASLPDSCSSFVAMKGDAIARSILADILSFNHFSSEQSRQLEVKKTSTRQENYKRLVSARDWIEDNFNQPLSLEELSGIAAMNRQHFLRLFTRLFGKTPHQYIIDRRIAEAKHLLTNHDVPILEVCLAIGWDSVGTFSHLFKQRTGQTPGEFRKGSGRDHIL
jgi:AraC-like DNA-binding protein